MVRVHLFIEGKVQGVGFRYFTQLKAVEMGLSGWVRNVSDGRVEILVEGPSDLVENFIHWAKVGPASARVSLVTRSSNVPTDTLSGGAFRVRENAT